jgi:hypothetical protein
MRTAFHLLCLAFCLSSLACGPSNDDLRAKLDGRAQFDLACKDLHIAPLEETNGYVVSYGVTGCGKRVTYVLNATTQAWVMNVADGSPTGVGPGEAPPPPAPPLPPPTH